MDKAELREAVEPYISQISGSPFLGRVFSEGYKIERKVIEDNFDFIVQHKKDLIENLLLSKTPKKSLKKVLKHPPGLIKTFLYIATHLDIPNDIITEILSDDWLGLYCTRNKLFNQSFFKKLSTAFGKNDLKQYICYETGPNEDILNIVNFQNGNNTINTNFIASKLGNIYDVCNTQSNNKNDTIFEAFTKDLESTSELKNKINILEDYSDKFFVRHGAANSLQVSIIQTFGLSKESREVIKKIFDATELIYFHDGIGLYQKDISKLNKDHIVDGLSTICETEGERKIFYNFIIQYSTSDTVKSIIKAINDYIIIYKQVIEEVKNWKDTDINIYIHNLSINEHTTEQNIKLGYIKKIYHENKIAFVNQRELSKNTISDRNESISGKLDRLLYIYDVLYSHYTKNHKEQKSISTIRGQLLGYSNDDLEIFSKFIKSYSHDEEVLSLFLQAYQIAKSIHEKKEFYNITNNFGLQSSIAKNVFTICINNQNTSKIKEILLNSETFKDKNKVRQYLYTGYLSDHSNENQLLFQHIKNFITDDLTHTHNLYKAIPIIKDFIVKNPESQNNILKLRHQVSKRSIEEQNAFCHTLILLHKQNKDILDSFICMCESIGNHQKRKNIIGFHKIIDIYYKAGGSKDINIQNEILIGIQENTFPIIDTRELFSTIAEKIAVPIDIFMEAIKNNIVTKFIGKIFSTDNILQNQILGVLISSYMKDGGISVRSNFCHSELPKLLQQYYEEDGKDISHAFSIDKLDAHTRPHLQHETSYTKHIDGITHKEQRHNIHNAFDELFDPDIYQDEYKSVMEKLYHKEKKAPIVELLKQINNENKLLTSLSFLLSHIEEIDVCLTSIKDDENDGQVYDNAIKKTQALYQKIYQDILQTGNEQRAIRCEEYSSHLGLILHDGDIAKEDSLRESMNLETTLTYDIVKILSHMRGCIGLHNNPVSNLNYLLPNRFFIYSQNQESEKGVSDQIVVVLSSPTAGPIYVMDTLYGTRNLSVIMNHIHTLYNHITSHKQYVNTPIFIPPNVISSAGMNTNTLLSELQKHFPQESIKIITNLEVDTTRAGYKEFSTIGQGILIYQNS